MRRTDEVPSVPAGPARTSSTSDGLGDREADGDHHERAPAMSHSGSTGPEGRTASAAGEASGGGGTENIGRMGRGAGLNVVGAALSQGSLFLILMILALNTSAADVGRYSLCYALLTVLSLLALGGVRATLTRFVAMRLADGDREPFAAPSVSACRWPWSAASSCQSPLQPSPAGSRTSCTNPG